MSLLVTGSIGIDTLETPFGVRNDVVGGSAIYFANAASFFTPVRLVGVVGEDAPISIAQSLAGRPIDASGLERRSGSKTFRWHGSYLKDLNEAQTLKVDLNVLAEQAPKIPDQFLDSEFVFLANTHPALQQQMLKGLNNVKLAVADTMNLWINNELPELKKLLRMIHGLVLNDNEARMLTGKKNLIEAGRDVLKMGPKFVIIKKGEHGSLLFMVDELFILPAFPSAHVIDPTGAGDSFAGGMMGYLASQGSFDSCVIRRAMAYGTVVASYTISDFSLDGLRAADRAQIDRRYSQFKAAMDF